MAEGGDVYSTGTLTVNGTTDGFESSGVRGGSGGGGGDGGIGGEGGIGGQGGIGGGVGFNGDELA